MDMKTWSRWRRVTAGGGLTLLGLGVLPVACAGDSFSSCGEPGGCSEGGAGGGAGIDHDATASSNSGGANGSTGDLTGSSGVEASGGSSGDTADSNGDGSGGSLGSAAADAGGSSSDGGSTSGTTAAGEAGEDGLGEGGTGVTGSCEDTCPATCCSGVCVDLDSHVDHCGGCGASCTLDRAEAACVAGACVVAQCSEQTVDCNGDPSDGCEEDLAGIPAATQLVRPMLGGFTGSLHLRAEAGSLRPEFAWTEVEPVTCAALTYQLQVDDECPFSEFAGCEFPSPEIDATGVTTATFVPEADLPVEEEHAPVGRRYYWRVRACEDKAICSEWSDVFYVDVGRVREDVTGDGYADVVGMTEDLELFIARGRADFYEFYKQPGAREVVPTSQTRLHPYANQLSFLGDVDGDGFNDVGGAGILLSPDRQALFVWTGAEAFGSMPGILVADGQENPKQYPGIWGAGDDDRDGFADMVVFRRSDDQELSKYSLKFGRAVLADSPEEDIPLLIQPPPPDTSMFSGATYGDFNGDGYPDRVLPDGINQEAVVVFLASSTTSPIPPRSIQLFPGAGVCQPTMASLDFNGDDIDDLAVLCRNQPQLAVVFGLRDWTFGNPEIWNVELDEVHADLTVGDVDNSGVDDLMVSGGDVFWGGPDPDTDWQDMISADRTDQVIVLGDHDADGDMDVMRAEGWYRGPVSTDLSDVDLENEDGEELVVVGLAR